jgi:hypothetical protein
MIEQGFTNDRFFRGGARATPAGVAPEASKESWTPLRAVFALGQNIFDPPFTEGCRLLIKLSSFTCSWFLPSPARACGFLL